MAESAVERHSAIMAALDALDGWADAKGETAAYITDPARDEYAALVEERNRLAASRCVPELDNHHNALVCGYCSGPLRDEVERLTRDLATLRAAQGGEAVREAAIEEAAGLVDTLATEVDQRAAMRISEANDDVIVHCILSDSSCMLRNVAEGIRALKALPAAPAPAREPAAPVGEEEITSEILTITEAVPCDDIGDERRCVYTLDRQAHHATLCRRGKMVAQIRALLSHYTLARLEGR